MPYIAALLFLGFTTALSIWAGVYIWRQRPNSGLIATWMAIMMAELTWWLILYILEISLTDPALKMVVYKAKYLGIVFIPVCWFAFAMHYTGREAWMARYARLLYILPLITTLMIWTNDLHHLMWKEHINFVNVDFSLIDSEPDVWFWVHAAYSYLMITGGTYLLFRQFMSAPALYRRQLSMLFVGVAAPLLANIYVVFGNAALDVTPFAFTLTGLALIWGLLRYQLFNLVPVARNTVIDSMTDGMIVLDMSERIVDLNPAALSMIGGSMEEVIGQPITSAVRLFAQQPELAEHYRVDGTVQGEVMIDTEDMQRTLDVRVSPLRDQHQRMTGRIIVFRDISERKAAEQYIQAQNEALLAANRELTIARQIAENATQMKSQALAAISHDIRTPLNSIIGYAELLLIGAGGKLTEQQAEYQQRVVANAYYLLTLTNDVLDLSRMEVGRMELTRKPFSVREWLEGIVRENRILVEAKKLRLDVLLDDTMPEIIVGDAPRLKQIVINLLSNAIKFTKDGFVRIQVRQHGLENWQIIVSDSGIGVPPEAQKTIFEEYRQVEGTDKHYGGTGLGLSIVRRLVELMDGEIQLQSEVSKGSIFTITLPYVQENEAEMVRA